MKAKIFEVVQYERNPKTGEALMTEQQIQQGLNHQTIKRWFYIWHDKDEFGYGNLKPKHAHIGVECPDKVDSKYIAKWFGVTEDYVNTPKGKGAFLDCLEYVTHEAPQQQAMGKYHYPDEEVHSNFDFRKELNERHKKHETEEAEKEKYGKVLTEKERIRNRVLFDGLSLRQLCSENPLAYQNDYTTLDKFRTKYLCEYAKMPTARINYYVCGDGGIGKGLISRALARSLCPDLENDDDIYFTIGTKGVTFEGYDGQPVIIWDDKRAADLLMALNGRDNVFNVFDPHPTKVKQQVKYSYTCLCNQYNIINGIQPYEEFLDGLAGEYTDRNGVLHKAEDKNQSYRRIPFIIPVHEEDFDLLMNKGMFEGTREYDQYIAYNNIRCNMRRIATMCGTNEKLRRQIEGQTVAPIISKSNQLMDKLQHPQSLSDDDLLTFFKDYGKQVIKYNPTPEYEQTNLMPPPHKHLSSDEIYCKI
ncbi:MAG: Rep family protein [Oscillospiraceae bacterium]